MLRQNLLTTAASAVSQAGRLFRNRCLHIFFIPRQKVRTVQALAPLAAAARRLAKETNLPAQDPPVDSRAPSRRALPIQTGPKSPQVRLLPSPLPSSASVYRAIGQPVWQRSAARNELSFARLSGCGSVPSPKQGPRVLARRSGYAKVELNGLGGEAKLPLPPPPTALERASVVCARVISAASTRITVLGFVKAAVSGRRRVSPALLRVSSALVGFVAWATIRWF